ncbi:Uncharacterised protein [Nocardia otitidiscaviarum]|uniref:Uncharacterized protein n=1 Tax=Nocardia otitidiscaviarum TaxID=1823 RepID=A0A378YRC3_9NOCA|nr:Uncharacterised protein [Nocardia otitidiscaviarum]
MSGLGPEVFSSTKDWPSKRVSPDELARRLAFVSTDDLVEFIVDARNSWHQRRNCVRALAGRTLTRCLRGCEVWIRNPFDMWRLASRF